MSAVLSECETYRYSLTREWADVGEPTESEAAVIVALLQSLAVS